MSENGVRSFHHSDFSLTKKKKRRRRKFQNALLLCMLARHLGLNSEFFFFTKRKKVKHAVFSLYKPWEMASCVYEGGMRSDVSGLPHISSESAQVSAHVAGCCSACQIRNWTCASYSSTISWSGLSCGENIQSNAAAWRYYMAMSVAFTSFCAICNEAVCWQGALSFFHLDMYRTFTVKYISSITFNLFYFILFILNKLYVYEQLELLFFLLSFKYICKNNI